MKLSEPEIKTNINPISTHEFEVESYTTLKPHQLTKSIDFIDVLENRSTKRDMGPIDGNLLDSFLYLSNRTKQTERNELGIVIEKKNYLTAGAMACVHTIFSEVKGQDWYVYEPKTHSKGKLSIATNESLNTLKRRALEMLPNVRDGIFIWYVADITRLSCKYSSTFALALRESGVLSSTHSLVAQYLKLAYCPLGKHGFEEARILSNKRQLMGVGLAFLGSPPN